MQILSLPWFIVLKSDCGKLSNGFGSFDSTHADQKRHLPFLSLSKCPD